MEIKEDFNHKEKQTNLLDTNVSDIVRWIDHGYDYALKMKEFYVVIEIDVSKNKVTLFDFSNGNQFHEDGNKRAIVHQASMLIKRNVV